MLATEIEIGESYATIWGKKVTVLEPASGMGSDWFKVRYHGGDEAEMDACFLRKTWAEYKESRRRDREKKRLQTQQAEEVMAYWPTLQDQVVDAEEVLNAWGLEVSISPKRWYFDHEQQRAAGTARIELSLRDLARLIAVAEDGDMDQVVQLDVSDEVLSRLTDAHRPTGSDALDDLLG